ncbi:MAG: C-terminal binding protein [Thermomicrobiales bacterium]|nr:C-terminal binding protein [Thermomicrobiales bacterium]
MSAFDRQPKVVVTDLEFPHDGFEQATLAPLGASVERHACRTEDEVIAVSRDADALLVQWAPVSARVIDALDRCRVISRYGIGVDNIDIAAATGKGIVVCNVPDYCQEEVATHAVALILALARRIVPLVDSVRAGEWDAVVAAGPIANLSDQTLGLLSLGRIGRLVARRAQAFGLRVIAHDPYLNDAAVKDSGVTLVDLPILLRESDYLSLHAPLTGETRQIIDAAALAQMRPTAQIVNTARGGLIDSMALAEAVREGRIGGAALDVLDTEPLPGDHPLRNLPNVLITPHAAWYSSASLPALRERAVDEIARFLRGDPQRSPVNPDAVAARS